MEAKEMFDELGFETKKDYSQIIYTIDYQNGGYIIGGYGWDEYKIKIRFNLYNQKCHRELWFDDFGKLIKEEYWLLKEMDKDFNNDIENAIKVQKQELGWLIKEMDK